ncbi:hypothetical protein BSK66_31860 [Paenibacillus odorifer]|uniref:RNA polymerase sigma-70 region 4 domain-containing protein n=1 Tax=Paenibacillus odorifer TaxID=189426 RepID=A0AB36J5D2_9BACL|nr:MULTISPECIES: sigma-70 family RNA polymerase sigma factor [Paenibacillus]ETT61033.1 hypothetical protein C171_13475 [Paenibacillus sp. FSL H8-237]OMD13707.1 hypothetical protein BJP47_24065 [Paenibacillus odorifer]OME07442.1 hypothetical protein BSK60_31460 [Paenibacillus odorifer]OME10269.1 hypothetical protein BSK47_31100 [Paenibacillus odorifer]OME46565.1 hypothetical protein BSK66_31860 [Paenibacillus odorifer]
MLRNDYPENKEDKDMTLEKRFVGYISSLLHYNSIYFDKKNRKHNERFSMVLDESDYLNHPAENSVEYSDNFFEELENQISDPSLYAAFINLTEREREILNFSIVQNMKDKEIANKLGVSQQSISKTKKVALKKLRESINRKEGKTDG